MNLVKNGAVLLAALSVFATTSCGGAKQNKELSFKDALAWVKENYGEADKRTVKSYTKSWDYSKNDGQGITVPDKEPWISVGAALKDWGYDGFVGSDINFMAKFALGFSYNIDKTKIDNKTGEEKGIETPSPLNAGIFTEKMDSESFDEFAHDELTMHFYIENGGLKVVNSYSQSEGDSGLYMHFIETDTIYYDKDGYVKKFDLDISSDRFYITYQAKNEGEIYQLDLGVVNMHTSLIPVVE